MGISALSFVVSGFSQSSGVGIAALIFSPIIFLILTVILRIYLEIVVVVFRIAEYLREMSGPR